MPTRQSRGILPGVALLAAFVAAPTIVRAQAAAIPVVAANPAADAFFTDPALAETRAIVVLQDGRRI